MAPKKTDDDPTVDVERVALHTSHDRTAVLVLNDQPFRLSPSQVHGLRRLLQAAYIEIGG